MFIATTALVALAALQQPTEASTVELAAISARLGPCSADFTVKDAAGEPIYAATVHVRIRYGFMGLKRMDLEVGTNADGRTRIEGLPEKARPLVYDVSKAGKKATVGQDLSHTCSATFDVELE